MSNDGRSTRSSMPAPSNQGNNGEEVTWLDFLRTAGGTAPSDSLPPIGVFNQIERKRRHTGSEPERRNYAYPHYNPAGAALSSQLSAAASTANVVGSTGSSRDNAVDLTISPRPIRPTVSRAMGSHSSIRSRCSDRSASLPSLRTRESEISLPPWQPDSDVSQCPVCHVEFSFWYRKHHCRKCGRVVCAACSPHRITIPRQYIVQPPNPYFDEEQSWLAERGDSNTQNSALGGGEVVRVCNPCVPDPWTPGTESSPHLRPVDGSFQDPTPSAYDAWRVQREQLEQSGRAQHPLPPRPRLRQPLPPRPPALPPYDQDRPLPYAMPSRNSQTHGSYSFPNLFFSNQGESRRDNRTRVTFGGPRPIDDGFGDLSAFPIANESEPGPSLSAASSPPRSERERRVVKEEDECPVCGMEMPPDEAIREAHIQDCISVRFASQPPHSTEAALSAARPTSLSSVEPSAVAVSSTPPSSVPTAPRPRATSYRPRGIAIYRATEKDCTNEAGDAQECVICFEEFQPGDEMGRMECLCKFHRPCIRQWWDTKGQGCCPTHQLHD